MKAILTLTIAVFISLALFSTTNAVRPDDSSSETRTDVRLELIHDAPRGTSGYRMPETGCRDVTLTDEFQEEPLEFESWMTEPLEWTKENH